MDAQMRYLLELAIAIAVLVPTVGVIRRRFGMAAGVGSGLVALAVIGSLATVSLCACGSDDRRHLLGEINSEASRIATVEEGVFDSLGHYLPLDSLRPPIEASWGRYALTLRSDSSYTLDAVAITDTTLTCRLEMQRSRHPDLSPHCHFPR